MLFHAFEDLASRHGLGGASGVEASFDAVMTEVLRGIAPEEIASFPRETRSSDGIVTLTSPVGVEETVERLVRAIDAQSDTIWFGRVDFQARARAEGVEIRPARLLLFGAPAPGARVMADAPTLGLDAFCQKLLVWEDAGGVVRVGFNDLLAVADHHGAPRSLVLRMIDHRLRSTFREALEPD